MNKTRILRSVFLSIVLLPTSCLAGMQASDQLSARQNTSGVATSPHWYENLLWVVALALMLVWAWAMKRLWDDAK